MTSTRTDDRLSKALAEIDAPPAPAGFTDEVLAGLDRRVAARRHRNRLLLAGAAAALAILAAGLLHRPQPRPAAVTAQSERLEQEYLRLAGELRELERMADESGSFVYLGSQNDYDLVLDLRPLLESSERGTYRNASTKETR